MNTFYSNGKLLLTGEYLVLEGATALAVPTKFGQDLSVEKIKEPQLIWGSFTNTGDCWFEAVFELPKLRLVNATFNSDSDGSADFIAETLQDILLETRKLNPEFLKSEQGFLVKTNLTFPRDWGLGTSSTLINNIAQWAKVDAFQLLWNSFSGSGYDIANAKHNTPILYQVNNQQPIVKKVDFTPSFSDQLFFVHLNKKQDSKAGIARFKEKREKINNEIQLVSEISKQLIQEQKLLEFEKLIQEHEKIISSIIELPTVKERLFPDYFGTLKSLGAWGGDFILATGNKDTSQYFIDKGYTTILSYSDMVL
ncbi:GYDIA family GHMP kinase [Flavobacteriaceae bacterium]|nr:GYDIA family GHMP kinase [Flavobacteriaceae bacterium]